MAVFFELELLRAVFDGGWAGATAVGRAFFLAAAVLVALLDVFATDFAVFVVAERVAVVA